jgi:hypothetical protein
MYTATMERKQYSQLISRTTFSHNKNQQQPPQQPTLLPLSYCQLIVEEERPSSWKHRLVQLSNLASILCVVDCTVLPLLTILLSLLGLAEQPHRLQWLHELGHRVAIYFVLPGMCLQSMFV